MKREEILTKLKSKIKEVDPEVDVSVGGPEAPLEAEYDEDRKLVRFSNATVALRLQEDLLAMLAHEAGHVLISQDPPLRRFLRGPVGEEIEAFRLGIPFARKWGVLEEYVGFIQAFARTWLSPIRGYKWVIKSIDRLLKEVEQALGGG